MGTDVSASTALTDMQMTFVREVSLGCKPDVACAIAGYADPTRAAWNLQHNPAVQAAVAQELRRFLYLQAAPAAVKVMFDFMVDEAVDKKLRLACAKTLADRAGFIAPKAKDNSALEAKSLVDMSANEMKDLASQIQRELSDRSVTIIDNAPAEGAQPSQVIDMFE